MIAKQQVTRGPGKDTVAILNAAEVALLDCQDYDLMLVGRKGDGFFRFRNYTIDKSWTGISDKPTYEDAREIAEYVTDLAATVRTSRAAAR